MKGGVCGLGLVDVEIESLGDIFTACWNDKQTWLASANKQNESVPLAKVIRVLRYSRFHSHCVRYYRLKQLTSEAITDLSSCIAQSQSKFVDRWLFQRLPRADLLCLWLQSCRANEVCDSFDSCVYDTNCEEVSRKNRQDKEKQQQKKQCDSQTILSVATDVNWVRPATSQPALTGAISQPSILFSDSSNDYSQWLRQPVSPAAHKIKDDVNLQVKLQSLSLQSVKCEDIKWLRCSSSLKDECKETSMKEAFDMMQSPWSQWLRC